jgi:exopolysaccharide biosynthesis polyprenyl glycosylphosphotransferase
LGPAGRHRLSAHTQQLRYRPRSYSNIGPVPFLDLSDKPITGWNAVVKAIEDRVLATLAIVLLAPVMALVWLAVRLESRGPAIFRQKRYGFNNELIEVYKFRSMYIDRGDPEARRLTTRDDPRVTRVGRFIRKTSLDELPQLFNVLKGELSMVGPRPQAPMAGVNNTVYADIVEEYFARTKVKPGITGWAQVNGWRGNTDTPEKIQRRVEFDLHYIENWSLLFDLYILARTPLSLLDTENAY